MLSLVLASFALVPSLYPSFHEWSVVNGRTYLTPTERDYRESVYKMNVRKIARHNNRRLSWKMGVNKFADMTKKEFSEVYLNNGYYNETTRPVRDYNWYYAFVNPSTLPSSVDWTTKGAVTPVKNQQQCGSCWAFSSTGALEGAWFVKHGVLANLSEQQLVDCSVPQGNQGCNGGLMDSAFQYVIKNGLTTEAAYPYTATGPNTCVAAGLPVVVTASSFKDVPTNSDSALMAAVVQQPVSVAVEADQNSFQFYSSGVLTASCGTNLDHGVLVVGYGAATGLDYYKVKNSWGADWGESGYIRLARGASYNDGAGQCGILMDPSYPVV